MNENSVLKLFFFFPSFLNFCEEKNFGKFFKAIPIILEMDLANWLTRLGSITCDVLYVPLHYTYQLPCLYYVTRELIENKIYEQNL